MGYSNELAGIRASGGPEERCDLTKTEYHTNSTRYQIRITEGPGFPGIATFSSTYV